MTPNFSVDEAGDEVVVTSRSKIEALRQSGTETSSHDGAVSSAPPITSGFLPYEKAVLSIGLLPRVSFPISQTANVPIGPIVIIVVMTIILRRAMHREFATHQHEPRLVVAAEAM